MDGISYKSYYAARQRRAIAATRQRTFAGRRHHAARQRGALARWHTGTRPASYVGKQRSDVRTHLLAAGFGYRPTLTSNVVTGNYRFDRSESRNFYFNSMVGISFFPSLICTKMSVVSRAEYLDGKSFGFATMVPFDTATSL